jgi:hypothetical protein
MPLTCWDHASIFQPRKPENMYLWGTIDRGCSLITSVGAFCAHQLRYFCPNYYLRSFLRRRHVTAPFIPTTIRIIL